MDVQHFSRERLPFKAWKNGGGTTQEIACWPRDAALDDFGWRVSIATIAAAGPFSVFPGIDRSIMLLDGDGVHLRSRDGSIDHRLDVPHQAFEFRGDEPMDCALLGGPSSDFNVMVRRGRWRAELQVLDGSSSIAAAPHGMVLALRGHWRLDAGVSTCRDGEGLCWNGGAGIREATPVTADARLAVVRFVATHVEQP